MNELTQLEEKYGFEYPAIYKELYKDGMLDWFRGWNKPWTPACNWYTEVYPTLLDNPPLLLHNLDFEIYEFKDIDEQLDDIPDYWNPDFKFVPFGMSGAGDWYAFYMNSPLTDSIPIVFAPHDEMNAQYRAKNMQDFIFREILEYAVWVDEKDNLKDEDKFRKNMASMLKSHSKYLTPSQGAILEEIYDRPIKQYKVGLTLTNPYTKLAFLGEEELNEIIKREIDFEFLDVEFQYML